MDLEFRDIHILNKENKEIYIDRCNAGDIIIRKNRIDILYKGEIRKTIVLPIELYGLKVLID